MSVLPTRPKVLHFFGTPLAVEGKLSSDARATGPVRRLLAPVVRNEECSGPPLPAPVSGSWSVT